MNLEDEVYFIRKNKVTKGVLRGFIKLEGLCSSIANVKLNNITLPVNNTILCVVKLDGLGIEILTFLSSLFPSKEELLDSL